MTRRGQSKIHKSFKDYLVPIILAVVFCFIVLNSIFGSDDTVQTTATDTFVTTSLSDSDSTATIEYTKGDPTDITLDGEEVYKTEKIKVSEGSVNIDFDAGKMVLNKLGELRYLDSNSFFLLSSDLWVEAEKSVDISLKYLTVSSDDNAVYSLSQNEVASSIYVLDGIVEVKSTNGTSVMLKKGEKIVALRDFGDSSKEVETLKEQIDDITKTDDWYISNNGDYFLEKESSVNLDSTGSLSTTTSTTDSQSFFDYDDAGDVLLGGGYIEFDDLVDEGQVTSTTIDVEGEILSTDVSKIKINGNEATLDEENGTFEYEDLKMENKTNDIVYKVYDINNNVLDKGVITVYFADGEDKEDTSGYATVENYPISSSPLYQILTPKEIPYTTTEKVIRVEGIVPAGTVSKIVINDFQLTKYKAFSSYWSYFANEDYGNLKDGVNLYKIEYYDADDRLINQNTLTIIKQPVAVETDDTTTEGTELDQY